MFLCALFAALGVFVSFHKWFFVCAFLCVIIVCVFQSLCEFLNVCESVLLYPDGPCHVTVTRKQLSVYCRFEEDLLHSLLPAERERVRRKKRQDKKSKRESKIQMGKHSHRKRRRGRNRLKETKEKDSEEKNEREKNNE